MMYQVYNNNNLFNVLKIKEMAEKKKKISENDCNEQVLSFYVDNRIKLMQEVLSLIKSKKIMSMAPDFMKNTQLSVVKSQLLEELLGISNKRLRNILAGENNDADSSSSSESEVEDKKCADTVSLQDITDDSDCCIDIQLSEQERLELEKDIVNIDKPNSQIKTEMRKGVKRKDDGKHKKKKASNKKIPKIEAEPVVNVLNLLELQARARAIRSQLANEICFTKDDKNTVTVSNIKKEKTVNECESNDENSSNSVICISPDNLSVVSVDSNSDINNSVNSPNVNKDEQETTVASDKLECFKNDLVNSKTIDETSTKDDEHEERDESDTPWKTRWLESKKVQDVMRTTKLYNNLRQSRKQKNISPEEINVENVISQSNNNNNNNNESADKSSTSHQNVNENND